MNTAAAAGTASSRTVGWLAAYQCSAGLPAISSTHQPAPSIPVAQPEIVTRGVQNILHIFQHESEWKAQQLREEGQPLPKNVLRRSVKMSVTKCSGWRGEEGEEDWGKVE